MVNVIVIVPPVVITNLKMSISLLAGIVPLISVLNGTNAAPLIVPLEATSYTPGQVTAALVVNCDCTNAPVEPVQLALTLQSYNEPAVNPLKFIESEVVAAAALIHVPDDASL